MRPRARRRRHGRRGLSALRADTPGLVCGHHHLYSALARGMPAPPRQPDDFLEILEQVWWRLDVALDLEMLRWSAHARRARGARERHAPRSSTTTSARTPSRAASTSSPTPAPRSACGWSCAYGVTDRHGPDGASRGWPRTSGSCATAGAGMVGVHAAFTCSRRHARARPPAWPRDLGVGVHIHVAEGDVDRDAGARLAPLAADDWLLVHCVHLDRDLPGTIAHNPRSNMNNAVGYARPAGSAQPGRARHRRHRRRHARGVPPGLRPPPRGRRDGRRRTRRGRWLDGGLGARPRGARRPGDLELRPRRRARGTSPSRPACGRSRSWSTARSLLRRRPRRPASTPTRCGPRPPSRPPASSPDSDDGRHDDRRCHRDAGRPLPAGRPPDPRGHGASPSTPRPRASTPCGRPRAAWCARPRCRWPPSPP